ncbi:hypothetical protein CK623_11430 [Vandammella animalimorsus]|uniref:Uncharacterized protein n=2 Tax=Vandammella animalimorsus TaxID=2029117 RepID=A0A2A2AMW4_9BURK|nr:hypothetical protein CK623_11430 [Vandammella animalimorsus]
MPMTMDELRASVEHMVRDQHQVLAAPERDRAIDMALARYGVDMPRRASATLRWQADGHAQRLPQQWQLSFELLHVELLGAGGRNEALHRYLVRELADGFELLLHERKLLAGSQVFIAYICPHEAGSIHPSHREAVAAYAAHLLCRQLAAHFSGEREAAIGADASQTESRARNYAARAAEWRASYFAALGVADPAIEGAPARPAAAVASWPQRHPRHQVGGAPTFRGRA